MKYEVLSIFPDMVDSAFRTGVTGRASGEGLIELDTVNIRDYSTNSYGSIDGYTYGGGAGMLMQCEPVYRAYLTALERLGRKQGEVRVIYMTPVGEVFSQKKAEELAGEDELIFLCGHYEGIDERVIDEIVTDRISIGDYVLTGGELSALVVMDTVARLIPGVLKNDESAQTESFNTGGLLEYPQYTRPPEWHEKKVPDILVSGDHAKVDKYRMREMRRVTKEYRPDLYAAYMEERGIY
ncbi:MAG TPA: tRNA (guanosine(37)-N1)-methyltransferase TrmD [Lachnospiraceae bacterium]|nr:tRNA (guanosine(37)-N1)-methyltransferase TrmD [Lachnospiraceae bacterium]MBQ9566719.1 tRNA (guanosine(37)-N1)-methyltransferase TrmD [Lachnospiraceae bacterium]MCR4785746.1 tRNA (guanosine(37)-N1)-methyltransferase TrmD [Lachnospiraceae bacterium]HAL32128.1 tRNA (guanosine(37)-N1)-methyltransferase TrmD [Lachnospiraceae bacterium]HBB59395.1 tRNA (guanosine(37)-N1)-methyltransferase TrmD [Lachnospiraceae bacterium]